MDYFAFQWHITDTCDQRCEHCYIFAEDHDARITQMSLEDMRAVLSNCLETCERLGRLPYFYITRRGPDPAWGFLGPARHAQRA